MTKTDNRTNEPTEAQIEAAAKIIRRASLETTANPGDFWSDCYEGEQEAWRNAARAALVAAQGAAPPVNSFDTTAEPVKTGADSLHVAPQAESEPKSSYISPQLPAQIRGLYRADLREKSIQTMLDLAGDLIQELIDLRAAPVLPSSGVDEDKLAEVIARASVVYSPMLDEEAQNLARAVAEWLKGQGR